MLRAKDIVLQMEITDADIRNDGWIHANARPKGPGVILSFDSKHGPLSYPCTFGDWQTNVRASRSPLRRSGKWTATGSRRRASNIEVGRPGAGGSSAP